jgi:hypothetical protein
MRTLAFFLGVGAAVAVWSSDARAQVTDAERAAARDLFKQGDDLQRAGKFAEALDKFQRAEQVFQAPTNVLRIAECQTQLGHLVEAAESYRSVARWQLPAGSPAAFQSAIDQARGELAQVEPRVPHLTVQATPANVPNEQLYIDGTAMPGALVGQSVPLDPGDHKVQVTGTGYASPEQTVTLRERDNKVIALQMATVPIPPGQAAPPAPASGTPPPPAPAGSSNPPPPAPYSESPPPPPKKHDKSVLLGAHLGVEIPAGTLPLSYPGVNDTATFGDVSGPGPAFGIDGAVRFARVVTIGMTLEHAWLGNQSSQGTTGLTGISSDTTAFAMYFGLIPSPQHVSFYGELGLGLRVYNFSAQTPQVQTQTYLTAELLAGIGVWIPVGTHLRLIPLVTGSFGAFSSTTQDLGLANPPSVAAGGHEFFMIGLDGFYDIEF